MEGMDYIFIISLIMLMGATGFAIGALAGVFLGRRQVTPVIATNAV